MSIISYGILVKNSDRLNKNKYFLDFKSIDM
jgi:hypothetical protein